MAGKEWGRLVIRSMNGPLLVIVDQIDHADRSDFAEAGRWPTDHAFSSELFAKCQRARVGGHCGGGEMKTARRV